MNLKEQREVLKTEPEDSVSLKFADPLNLVLREDLLSGLDYELVSREMWDFLRQHNVAPNCTEIKRLFQKAKDDTHNCTIDLNYVICNIAFILPDEENSFSLSRVYKTQISERWTAKNVEEHIKKVIKTNIE